MRCGLTFICDISSNQGKTLNQTVMERGERNLPSFVFHLDKGSSLLYYEVVSFLTKKNVNSSYLAIAIR